MLDVQKAGRYRITLRQFPKEAHRVLVAKKATIEIAGLSFSQSVKDQSSSAVFEVTLPEGQTTLTTYLYDEHGDAGGAYFTEVESL